MSSGPGGVPGARRWVVQLHRVLGLVIGPLMALWFVSGIAMIYAGGMPSLTSELRLERLAPLDLDAVRISPSRAAAEVAFDAPTGVVLLTILGRPAYRFGGPGGGTVFADTGEPFRGLDVADAEAVAAAFAGVPPAAIRYDRLVREADQWTIGLRRQLPLHKLRVEDGTDTHLYVSPDLGEVVQVTTRGSRALAWVAAIPHWLYLAPLRLRDGLWRQVVMWTAGLGCVLAILGLTLGVSQLRVFRARSGAGRRIRIPYSGWMRWHYLTGVTFGLVTLTWVFSGLLSMEPWGWASGRGLATEPIRRALAGGPLELASFPPIDAAEWEGISDGWEIKEISFVRILGAPTFRVRTARPDGAPAGPDVSGRDADDWSSRAGSERLVHGDPPQLRTVPFDEEVLVQRAARAYPEVPIRDAEVLGSYDSYHYSRDGSAPVPVLRIRFQDRDATWIYVDPATASLVGAVSRLDRVERWIYRGFHSLDFAFWYRHRPAWDLGIIFLCLGGLATTMIGLALGWKRLSRRRGL